MSIIFSEGVGGITKVIGCQDCQGNEVQNFQGNGLTRFPRVMTAKIVEAMGCWIAGTRGC